MKTVKDAILKKETTEFLFAWKLTEGHLVTNGNVGDYEMEYDKIRDLDFFKFISTMIMSNQGCN